MKKVLEGSQSVAEAVRLARVDVISAYPITPQTHIVERLSEFGADGSLTSRFLRVESEHSAMAALIGASSGGVRTFTATSSQGLALMHELLHWAAAARLPIVMAEVNRAMAPGWNIWADQTDSLSQRDTGWIQMYCENGQEVLDSTLMAYRISEEVNLPTMIVLDAFYLSHTYEPVDIPAQSDVDAFLPRYEPKFSLDNDDPRSLSSLVTPDAYMEMRYSMSLAMNRVISLYEDVEDEYEKCIGRRSPKIETVYCEDADIIIVTSSTITSTAREVVDKLRTSGEKVGLLKIKLFRPFPVDGIQSSVRKAKKLAVIDRNFSFGATGIFAQEIRAALCTEQRKPTVFGYIAGLGGRDVTMDVIEDIYRQTQSQAAPASDSIWIGLKGVNNER